jgi:hypothetical protein
MSKKTDVWLGDIFRRHNKDFLKAFARLGLAVQVLRRRITATCQCQE